MSQVVELSGAAAPLLDRPHEGTAKAAKTCAWLSHTNLGKFYSGSDLTVGDADAAVNTLGVVAALLLTVPFSLIGSLNNGFWDGLQQALAACGHTTEFTARIVFDTVYQPLNALMYFSMGTILLATLYYVLRPTAKEEKERDELFRLWWRRGRIAFLVMISFVISAVVCAFTVYNVLVPGQWLVGFSADVCEHSISHFGIHTATDRRYMVAVAGGMAPILLLVALSGWLMLLPPSSVPTPPPAAFDE